MKILLVEDDALIGDAIEKTLSRERHSVHWTRSGLDASHSLDVGDFDLVVLNLGLPDIDGLDVLNRARSRGDETAVLILTARDAVEDKISGLDSGADDYLIKPFDMDELLARCRALARRRFGTVQNELNVDGLRLSIETRLLEVEGVPVILSRHEFLVLQMLMERRGRVVTKDQLSEALYGWDDGAESNAVEVYVSQIRKKIGGERIKTLRGVGYLIS